MLVVVVGVVVVVAVVVVVCGGDGGCGGGGGGGGGGGCGCGCGGGGVIVVVVAAVVAGVVLTLTRITQGISRVGSILAGQIGSRCPFSRVGSGQGDPTQPEVFRTLGEPPRLDTRGFERSLARPTGSIMSREKSWYNQVRGHRIGSSHSSVEEYPPGKKRKRTKKC